VVTAVCSTGKVDQARTLGADYVVDYTKDDFTRARRRYDLILGVNGFQSLRHCRRALRPGGTYVMAGGRVRQIFQYPFFPFVSLVSSKSFRMVAENANRDDYLVMKELYETGKVRPVVDRVFAFDELPEAMAYLGGGHAAGKIVVTVAS
jgi:NADPH:quinone reductase-like Zn-dependent oxidoreductase